METKSDRAPKPLGRKKSIGRVLGSSILKLLNLALRLLTLILSALAQRIGWVKLRFFDYTMRPDDIFIASYPRSGTTWLQMILYQLSSDGNMEFEHISEKIPWFERFADMPKDIEAIPSRRIFKTHLPFKGVFHSIPKGACKYIYIVRDGRDVLISYYHFYQTHFHFRGRFSRFVEGFMEGKLQYGSWFKHVAGWYTQMDNPAVLFLKYEELLEDLEGNVRRIAEFCGFQLDSAQLARVVERSSFSYMKQYEEKFDHLFGVLWEKGLTHGSFLRKGQSGEGGISLDEQQMEWYEREYRANELVKWIGETGYLVRMNEAVEYNRVAN